ncbi:MAG: hypothetical protein JO110_28235 [Acetobacteraceae bacterium]|nr:hypothetical protein [Acetobacteraceae bacterium]
MAASAFALLQCGASKAPAPWQVPTLAVAIAALIVLHDLGKFSRCFQSQSPEHWPLFLGPLDRRPGPKHDSAGFIMLDKRLGDLLDPLLPGWRESGRAGLLRALCGHHGRPPEELNYFPEEVIDDACLAAARAFGCAAIQAIDPPHYPSRKTGISRRLGGGLPGSLSSPTGSGLRRLGFPISRPSGRWTATGETSPWLRPNRPSLPQALFRQPRGSRSFRFGSWLERKFQLAPYSFWLSRPAWGWTAPYLRLSRTRPAAAKPKRRCCLHTV